jgi:hypothetical protein
MAQRLIPLALLLATTAPSIDAADRFAVLEFFGRPNGTFCSAAGPAMLELQTQLAGEAELLEYDYDGFPVGRIDRFWATGSSASYLPLVMVGSGYRTSSGHVDYRPVYAGMIGDERARAPEADITAFWRRTDASVHGYLTVRNTRDRRLRVAEDAAVWLVVFERARIGVSTTWVRSTGRHDLAADLAPGEDVDLVVEVPVSGMSDWGRAAVLVMVEDRPLGGGRYDMLQAALAEPAGLTASPDRVVLTPAATSAEIVVAGPHVLSWTASSTVPWLAVEPAAGQPPQTVTITLEPDLRPPGELTGTIVLDAAGDGMAFTARVDVELGGLVRHAGGRRQPDP